MAESLHGGAANWANTAGSVLGRRGQGLSTRNIVVWDPPGGRVAAL